eukprot:79876_1
MEEHISIFLESGFQVYEHDKVPIWDESKLFQVGHTDQFKQFAPSNIFKLYDTFMHPTSDINQWTIPKSMKNELGLRNIKSITDFYPFINTFPDTKSIPKSSHKKSHSKHKMNNWKRVANAQYGHLMDTHGDNMPFLVRDDQELLIWRDRHDAITNMHTVQKVLTEYNPDIIVLEATCDESTMKIYGKSSYNMYLKLVKNVFSRVIRSAPSNRQSQERLGRFMFRLADVLFVRQGEIQKGAFVNHGIIKHMMDQTQKQPLLVFGDLNLDICGVLMVFAEYLDTFQLPMLVQLLSELDDNMAYANPKNDVNFEDIYAKLSTDLDGYRVLTDVLFELLSPHRSVVVNYRNQFLCLAINEAAVAQQDTFAENKCKVLTVMGDGHVNDVMYKLQNIKQAMVNPFKKITLREVLLKPDIPVVTTNSFDRNLNELEQEFVVKEFGHNLLQLLQNRMEHGNLLTNI